MTGSNKATRFMHNTLAGNFFINSVKDATLSYQLPAVVEGQSTTRRELSLHLVSGRAVEFFGSFTSLPLHSLVLRLERVETTSLIQISDLKNIQ